MKWNFTDKEKKRVNRISAATQRMKLGDRVDQLGDIVDAHEEALAAVPYVVSHKITAAEVVESGVASVSIKSYKATNIWGVKVLASSDSTERTITAWERDKSSSSDYIILTVASVAANDMLYLMLL